MKIIYIVMNNNTNNRQIINLNPYKTQLHKSQKPLSWDIIQREKIYYKNKKKMNKNNNK